MFRQKKFAEKTVKDLVKFDSNPKSYDNTVQSQVTNQRVEDLTKAQSDNKHTP